MKVVKCDICNKTNDEVEISYRFGQPMLAKWVSCGHEGWWKNLDICDKCFGYMVLFIVQSSQKRGKR
jgi:uncharacterized membrane protein